jgi:hypothetical protein
MWRYQPTDDVEGICVGLQMKRSKINKNTCSPTSTKKGRAGERETSRVKMKQSREIDEENRQRAWVSERLSTESEAKLLPSRSFPICEVDANTLPSSWAKEIRVCTYW